MYKAAENLLELVNLYFVDKMLFLSKTTENTLSIVKTLVNNTDVKIQEGQSIPLEDSY